MSGRRPDDQRKGKGRKREEGKREERNPESLRKDKHSGFNYEKDEGKHGKRQTYDHYTERANRDALDRYPSQTIPSRKHPQETYGGRDHASGGGGVATATRSHAGTGPSGTQGTYQPEGEDDYGTHGMRDDDFYANQTPARRRRRRSSRRRSHTPESERSATPTATRHSHDTRGSRRSAETADRDHGRRSGGGGSRPSTGGGGSGGRVRRRDTESERH